MSEKPIWTIARARQHLSELVASAAHEPQKLYRRDRVVAAVVNPSFLPPEPGPKPADILATIRRACAEQNYELPIAPRTTRPQPASTPPKKPTRRKP